MTLDATFEKVLEKGPVVSMAVGVRCTGECELVRHTIFPQRHAKALT